jgi:hypothetical protein
MQLLMLCLGVLITLAAIEITYHKSKYRFNGMVSNSIDNIDILTNLLQFTVLLASLFVSCMIIGIACN